MWERKPGDQCFCVFRKVFAPHASLVPCDPIENKKTSRRLWRSRRRKSSSVPEGAANFPAAVFLAGKCPNLGRDSIACCRKMRESFSSSVEICRKTLSSKEFLTATAFSSFLREGPTRLACACSLCLCLCLVLACRRTTVVGGGTCRSLSCVLLDSRSVADNASKLGGKFAKETWAHQHVVLARKVAWQN